MGTYEFPKYKKAMKSFNKFMSPSKSGRSLTSSLKRLAASQARLARAQEIENENVFKSY